MRRVLVMFGVTVMTTAGALGACGDDGGKTTADAADTAVGDTADDTGADTTTTADTSDDATADADTSEPVCTDPSVTLTMADADLDLTVCGATLHVAKGALAAGKQVTLARVEPPAVAPFEQAFVGPVLEITTTDDEDLLVPATLFMPDISALGGYRTGVRWESATSTWQGFEACPADGGVEYTLSFGGIFALLRDTVVFPDHKEGLGSGTLTSHIDDVAVTWTIDEQGWAIHDLGASGLRTVQIGARRTPDGGSVQQLTVQLVEEADHSFAPLEVSLLDTAENGESWSWLEPVDGPPTSSSVIGVAGGRLVGSIVVTARGAGDTTTTLTIDIDATTERYRYPPEASCFPDG